MASVRNTRSRSVQPPAKPETRPSSAPMTTDTTTERSTTSSAVRAPQMHRDSTS